MQPIRIIENPLIEGYVFSVNKNTGWAESLNEIDIENEYRRSKGKNVINPLTTSHITIIKAFSLDSKLHQNKYDANAEFMVVQLDKDYSNNLKDQDIVGVLNLGGTTFSHEIDYITQHINNHTLKDNSVPITPKHIDVLFGDKMLRVVKQDATDFKKVKIYTMSEALEEMAEKGYLPINEPYSVVFSLDDLKANQRQEVMISKAYDSSVGKIISGAPAFWSGYLQNLKEKGYTHQLIGLPEIVLNTGLGVSLRTSDPGVKDYDVNGSGHRVGVEASGAQMIAELGLKFLKNSNL